MINKLQLTSIYLLISIVCFAQKAKGIETTSNWMVNWTNFKPISTNYNEAEYILNGVIDKNTKLLKRNTYILTGVIYVTQNATLTIEPGTVIRGDEKTCGTLVITKGAKIIAEGTETDPIVFTSNKEIGTRRPGDWGGIILLGNAPINKLGGVSFLDFNLNSQYGFYGGQNPEDNSGILKYVRIEYAGRKLNSLKELNGLSLAGIGNKTLLDYIQISFSNDDSFESYGGAVNLSHLISYRTTDDDFDFTQGVQANINNSIAIRYPYNSDISGSRCFEIDSYDKVENADFKQKGTNIIAENMTLINMEENDQGLIRESIYIKENSNFTLKNSIISGFNSVVLLGSKIGISTENLNKITFEKTLINNSTTANVYLSEQEELNNDLKNWFHINENLEYTNMKLKDLFMNPNIKTNPDFRFKNIALANN
ncbi:hypothetical protein [Flavobacterium undicola]|uniref:hypothetical protein n=1 Tax=Flavobacterium undicola TaxID=1932779 RepID=UPI001378F41E|nr:hypothetical protein [Flavobacterium undicola]MBA0883625.1 hypothetical protein [Flavobacterium undicola]